MVLLETIFGLAVLVLPVISVDPEVITTTGSIRGFIQRLNGIDVKTFLGIPYAKPPIGNLRFKKPVRVAKWNSILETKTYRNACYQPTYTVFQGTPQETAEEMWNPKTNMSEDCLHLNIWAPDKQLTTPFSTIIWIYGGSFSSGSTDLEVYNGKYLASLTDVIVASLSYRVGPLGFMYLGDDLAPGNMGLLDQNMAIKWVYDNIERFGGSKNRITLFGESAGAASVHYHMISSLSNGLFQRAILQSSSALGHWTFRTQEVAKRSAMDLVNKVKCNKQTTEETMTCMRNADVTELLVADFTPPTIDNLFINKTPMEYFRRPDFVNKDILMGVNTEEYMYFLLYWIYDPSVHPNYNFNQSDVIAQMHHLAPNLPRDTQNAFLVDAVLHEYDKAPYPYQGTYTDVMDSIGGDYYFKCPVVKFAQLYNKQSSGSLGVYMYSFEHRSSGSGWPTWMGVLHGDEIEYIFGLPTDPNLGYTPDEAALSRKMMKYWTNFAKSGNPNGDTSDPELSNWPKYKNEEEEYIMLKSGQQLSTNYGLRHKQCKFWNEYLSNLENALDHSHRPLHIWCSSGVLSISAQWPSLVTIYVIAIGMLFIQTQMT